MKRIDIEEYEVAVKHARKVLHGREKVLDDGSVGTPITVFRDGFRPAEYLVVIKPETEEEPKHEAA